jgi:hypothetical protein
VHCRCVNSELVAARAAQAEERFEALAKRALDQPPAQKAGKAHEQAGGSSTEPPLAARGKSDEYGVGASAYDEPMLRTWRRGGEEAARAAKARDWPTAIALFARCVQLRPDWEKGVTLLERARAARDREREAAAREAADGEAQGAATG